MGLIDGIFRQGLEETNMGFGLEVDLIRQANELDMLTCPYVFDAEQAVAMSRAGADVLVPHMGLTTKGSIGATTALTLDDAVASVQAIHDAAVAEKPDAVVLCHGGPIADPDDVRYVLENTEGVAGILWRLKHRTPADGSRNPPAGRGAESGKRLDAVSNPHADRNRPAAARLIER